MSSPPPVKRCVNPTCGAIFRPTPRWKGGNRHQKYCSVKCRRLKLSPITLREMAVNGATRSEIATHFGCSVTIVKRRLRQLGVRLRKGGRKDPARRAQIMNLVLGGYDSAGKLAPRFGVSRQAVGRIVCEMVSDGLLGRSGAGSGRRLTVIGLWHLKEKLLLPPDGADDE